MCCLFVMILLDNARSKPDLHAHIISCVHIIPLFLLFFPSWWGRDRRRLLLLHEIFPVERARGVQFQPGGYAFQVEHVVLVAG